ncbi:hypothetical protein SCHPADRAFT_948157, partial [Schizopora paradoxa]
LKTGTHKLNPVTKFLNQFFLKWYLTFPDYSNGKKEVDADKLKKQIRSWFNNHTGVRAKVKNKRPRIAKIHTSGKAPRDPFAAVLLGETRTKQKLQPKQAYAAFLAAEGTPVKSKIEEEWKQMIEVNPELKDEKGAYLNFYSKRVGELYDATSLEVKAKVELFREDEHKRALESSAPPPLLLPHEESLPEDAKTLIIAIRTAQQALENVEYACECFANTVHRLTKANILIHVAGPEPASNGNMQVSAISAGTRLSDGKDIFQAHPELMERVEGTVKGFAKTCVDEDTINGIKLAYPSSSAMNPSATGTGTSSTDLDDESPSSATSQLTTHSQDEINSSTVVEHNPWVVQLSTPTRTSAPAKSKRVKFKEPLVSTLTEDTDQWQSSDDDEGDGRNQFPTMPNPSSLLSPSLEVVDSIDGDGDSRRFKLRGGKWVTPYELEVLQQRARNKMLMRELGIPDAVRAGVEASRKKLPPPLSQQRARILPDPRIQPARASKAQVSSYAIPGPDDLDTPSGLVDLDDTGLLPFDDAIELPSGPDSTPGSPSPSPKRSGEHGTSLLQIPALSSPISALTHGDERTDPTAQSVQAELGPTPSVEKN